MKLNDPFGFKKRAEEKKRKKAAQTKKALTICGICLVVVAIIITIGAIGENKESAISDDPSAVSSTDSIEGGYSSDPSADSAEETNESDSSTDNDSNIVTDNSKKEESQINTNKEAPQKEVSTPVVSLSEIPSYSGDAYITINNNVPYFTQSEIVNTSYEYYSPLDSLGRCGVAVSCVGKDTMPTEERGSIGQIKPSGWHTIKYDCVDGKYLYNRCHLIGYQLTAENANIKNLITGTRYLNIQGMLPFENMVADYIKETNNHVMYRVTPVFDGNNLLATGVLMEARSVEDDGDGILFNVFCYNVQPGITIDYSNGDSSQNEQPKTVETIKEETTQSNNDTSSTQNNSVTVYVSSTGKIHSKSNCSGMKSYTEMSYDEAVSKGYVFCKKCY